MTDVTSGNPEQALRLFFSIDLSGSTKYKYSNSPNAIESPNGGSWQDFFIEFFNDAGTRFWANMRTSSITFSHQIFNIEFWKTLGDEILFHSTQISPEQPFWQIRAFLQTVEELHEKVQRDSNFQLGAKGVVWSAGFPIRNKRIFLDHSNGTTVYEGDEETLSIHEGAHTGARALPGSIVDFMGLEMDQGFRLASFSVPGRVITSPDASFLMAQAYLKVDSNRKTSSRTSNIVTSLVSHVPELQFMHVGWETLKGVLGELPVPIFWPECRFTNKSSTPNDPPFIFDPGRSKFWREYQLAEAMSATDLRAFFTRWNEDLAKHGISHILPYIVASSDIDRSHREAWAKRNPTTRVDTKVLKIGDQE